MSWEVPITMSKISFFNPTVFKRNTKSYWPVWAVYLFIMLLAVPTVATDAGAVEIQQRMLNTAKGASIITGFFYAPIASMAVFSYLYNQRLAGGTAALPVRRETQFLTDVLSIIIWSVGVHVITAVMTILVTDANLNAYAVLAILKWLVNGILNTLFFIGLAAF